MKKWPQDERFIECSPMLDGHTFTGIIFFAVGSVEIWSFEGPKFPLRNNLICSFYCLLGLMPPYVTGSGPSLDRQARTQFKRYILKCSSAHSPDWVPTRAENIVLRIDRNVRSRTFSQYRKVSSIESSISSIVDYEKL